MAFSIAPLADIPPPNAESFPNYLQLQSQGEDLGLPDADTINFAGGLTATRGTGENANVVTVIGEPGSLQVQEDGVDLGPPTVDTLNFSSGILATRGSDNTVTITVSGGGGVSASLLTLETSPDPPGSGIGNFDGVPFGSFITATAVVPSENWELDGVDVHFLVGGIYRFVINSFIQANTEWPDGNTTYGATIDEVVIGRQARSHTTGGNDSSLRVLWTDQSIQTLTEGSIVVFDLFALANNTSEQIDFAGMTIAIERLADEP